MRDSTIHSLVVARTLLEQASPLCYSEDRYIASTGLILLQDSLESVLYAIIIELGLDEQKNLERKSFDELIGELKSAGIVVPRSGTLKALNRLRVLVKHYAQLAEPAMVRAYYDEAEQAIDLMTTQVLGQSLQNLFIADLLPNSEAKDHLKLAEIAIKDKKYLEALIETRKAFFIEFEAEYCIHGWNDYDGTQKEGLLAAGLRGGWSAPHWKRNKQWIEQNVKIPTDYIQIDYQELRLQAMELGIHTIELQNLQRLTPKVFRAHAGAGWSVTYDAVFGANNATESNARYCLDRAVSILLKKFNHSRARREPTKDLEFDPPPIYTGQYLYDRPSTESATIHTIQDGFNYYIRRIVGGFNPEESFYEVSAESEKVSESSLLGAPDEYYRGYLLVLPEKE